LHASQSGGRPRERSARVNDGYAPEGQVAEQVGLSQVHAGRVQGLEDPVRVVALPGGDVNDSETLNDDGCEPVEIERIAV
jgi:hypothetical protein